jgi:hypothetical protein
MAEQTITVPESAVTTRIYLQRTEEAGPTDLMIFLSRQIRRHRTRRTSRTPSNFLDGERRFYGGTTDGAVRSIREK